MQERRQAPMQRWSGDVANSKRPIRRLRRACIPTHTPPPKPPRRLSSPL